MNCYIQFLNHLMVGEHIELSEEHKILIAQYWKHIPHNDNDINRFWYPYYEDFKYLWEDEHL